jgi:hypothetical protein
MAFVKFFGGLISLLVGLALAMIVVIGVGLAFVYYGPLIGLLAAAVGLLLYIAARQK